MRKLPFEKDLNTVKVLLQLNKASNSIGELNGILKTLPNPNIILNAISLGEAKSSSEVENIVTTYDELYNEASLINENKSAKEVLRYQEAINCADQIVVEREMITTNDIVKIHHIIEPNKGAIRNQSGTVIKNEKTNEIVHTPPQNESEIRDYLQNLENYINSPCEKYDPLINMAIIHYQFETVHPFFDGNGRTGRVLNIAYLRLQNKLNLPLLYLSKYINENKDSYYQLLADVQKNEDNIENFVIYMLKAVEEMSIFTVQFIDEFISCMDKTNNNIKEQLPKRDASEITAALFYNFVTKNETFREILNVSRTTATTILKELVEIGVLTENKVGKEVFYKNVALFELLKKWD
ncbi:MAG: Fic/DOC family N-terminal domain-containing protein [Erysipelothrix sp.]